MVLTESTMMELTTSAPAFDLLDVVTGTNIKSSELSSKPLLIMFICSHCPYVKHVEVELAKIGKDYAEKVDIVAISSNDSEMNAEDTPDGLKRQAQQLGFSFPYFYDETQEVAKAYTAACTPDLFLFDTEHRLVYRGQLDDSRPGNGIIVTGKDLRAALDVTLAGEKVDPDQKVSSGCNIKWKLGNEPDYSV